MKTNILFKSWQFYKWNIPFIAVLWFLVAVIGVLAELTRGLNSINNYLIFENVFWHTIHQQPLYSEYPTAYFDTNHYGPSFSFLIAPFAWMNVYVGCFLWGIANAAFLYYAVHQLPVDDKKKYIILFIGLIEMMTSIQNVQFNPMLTAWIILSYTLVEKEKEFWATFFIVAGLLVKLYGVVGIAFFWFSNNKIKFILSFIFWLAILVCLPMLISSPQFILQSYKDWYSSLSEKNTKNAFAEANNFMQDISVLGMVRRIFNISELKNYFITLPAAMLYALPFLRFKQLRFVGFQLSYLALALIGVVIFSTSAESATYVIAMLGVGIWYVLQTKNNAAIALMLLALLITSVSATDLFPSYIRMQFIRPYSLKALPCFLVWLVLVYQLLSKDFSKVKLAYD